VILQVVLVDLHPASLDRAALTASHEQFFSAAAGSNSQISSPPFLFWTF